MRMIKNRFQGFIRELFKWSISHAVDIVLLTMTLFITASNFDHTEIEAIALYSMFRFTFYLNSGK